MKLPTVLVCLWTGLLLTQQAVGAEVSTTILFDRSDSYAFWLRYRADNPAQIQVVVDGTQVSTVGLAACESFTWVQLGPPVQLARGSHRILLHVSSPGVYLDKLDVSADLPYRPSGFGSAEVLDDLSVPEQWQVIDLGGDGGTPFFADFTDDGKVDFLITGEESVTLYDNSGALIWRTGGSGLSHPDVGWGFYFRPYDIDGDGEIEAIGPIRDSDGLYLACLSGVDGQVEAKVRLALESGLSYESTQIANLDGGNYSRFVVVKQNSTVTPYTTFRIYAYEYLDGQFVLRWTFGRDNADKGVYHTPLVFDVDGDGRHEILLGHWLLDEDGHVLWEKDPNFYDDERHVDSMRPGDIDPDRPGVEIAVASGFLLMSSDGETIWRKNQYGPLGGEGQSVAIGEFRSDLPGLELLFAIQAPDNDEKLFSAQGELLWTFDGPSEFDASFETSPIRWIGDRQQEIIEQRWGRGRVVSIFDEYGNLVEEIDPSFEFGEVGYRVADVCGDFREEIVFFNHNYLIIYRNGAPTPFSDESPWLDPRYVERQVNWVYY